MTKVSTGSFIQNSCFIGKNSKIGEACKCVTAYYEATYDYDTFRFMMDTENFNTTESYKQEMFHISYQCAQWVLGAGQGT